MPPQLSGRFRAITSSYYRGALGALLVYDISRRVTFENMKRWLNELREFGSSCMAIVLVGNKSDLTHSRQVDEEEGKTLAQVEGLYFMETSAMENINVEEAFLQLIRKIYETTIQKSLEAKLNEPIPPTIQPGKEIISIDDEVTATRQYRCCYR